MYAIGNHFKIAYKVGSQFAWIDCTLCRPHPTEQIRGTWPIIPSENRIYDEMPGERLNILTLLSGLDTHTRWHEGGGKYVSDSVV